MASVVPPPSNEVEHSEASTTTMTKSDINTLYTPEEINEAVDARTPINALTWMIALLLVALFYVIYFSVSHVRLKRHVERERKKVNELVPGAYDETAKDYQKKYKTFTSTKDGGGVHVSELKT
jgi:hypothetical protein